MSNIETPLERSVRPYCREHQVLMNIYNKKDRTYQCPKCETRCSVEELSKQSYTPYHWKYPNPFVKFI